MFSIRERRDARFVHLIVRGDCRTEDADRLCREVARRGRRGERERLLVEFRATGAIPTSSIYAALERPAVLGLHGAMRIALVARSEHALECIHFAATVLHNRGIGCAAFAGCEAARDWLVPAGTDVHGNQPRDARVESPCKDDRSR